MSKFTKNILCIIVGLAILVFISPFILKFFFFDKEYNFGSTEVQKKFEISVDDFKKNKESYEEMKNCFKVENLVNISDCKNLDYKLYLDKLKLNLAIISNGTDASKKIYIIRFEKKKYRLKIKRWILV